ncbi:MAG: hypothetical protein LBS82_01770 [Spirochaetaceae bacterium]|nr:hypothetical protein [Spirochaetaceae bacterium]
MKRTCALIVVGLTLSCVGVFADHPGGLGLGLVGSGNYDGWGNAGLGNMALSLKASSLPVFWGVNFGLGDPFWLGVTGDYYVIDINLSKNGMLGWYLGAGLLGNFWFGDGFSMNLAGRIPIGLSLQVLSKRLEVFGQLVPSLGLHSGGGNGFYWGIGGEAGIRVWI